MSVFKNFLRKILLKLLQVEVIENAINERKINSCKKACKLGKNSKLYPETTVFNLQDIPSRISIDEDTHIRGELLTFAFGGEIKIGSNTYIGEGTKIRSAEKITIGNNVLISHCCNIIDTDSHEFNYLERADGFKKMISTGHSKVKGNIITKPIVIHDYAWLSYNVSILKGVTVGKGAIIAAGSVVTKDVSEFTIVAGNPAKFIKNIPH